MIHKEKAAASLPFGPQAALRAWGIRISIARRSRRWTLRDLAAKAGIAPGTTVQIEKGGGNVQLANWLRVLWALDLIEPLTEAAKLTGDSVEFNLLAERLPKRVRR